MESLIVKTDTVTTAIHKDESIIRRVTAQINESKKIVAREDCITERFRAIIPVIARRYVEGERSIANMHKLIAISPYMYKKMLHIFAEQIQNEIMKVAVQYPNLSISISDLEESFPRNYNFNIMLNRKVDAGYRAKLLFYIRTVVRTMPEIFDVDIIKECNIKKPCSQLRKIEEKKKIIIEKLAYCNCITDMMKEMGLSNRRSFMYWLHLYLDRINNEKTNVKF